MSTYDLVVIGAGPGGYVAAIRAAQLGLKTAIVEKDKDLGGTCLLRGCIPTKALLHSADLLDELREAKQFGILADNITVDFAGVQKARQKAVVKSAAGVKYLMKQNGIDVHSGHGRLAGKGQVSVEDATGKRASLATKQVVLATGSEPKAIPGLSLDGKRIVTSNEMLTLEAPPKSLLVLGAGAVGVEFASLYRRFGSEVTLVEMLEQVLPFEDAEVAAELDKALKKRGIKVHTSSKLESAKVQGDRVVATVSGPNGSNQVEAEMLLVAVGRAPVTRDLGLETVGLAADKQGFIEVDSLMRTKAEGIFAIGDIVRTPQLAHVASAEGVLVAELLAGKKVQPINYRHSPSAVYCDPEVASVGLSEKKAKEEGYDVRVGRFPFSASGKARILGKNEGFVKVVAEAKYDELLGVHIIGPHATDLIAEAVLALRLESTVEELTHTIHAHPTLPEAVHEAAHGAHGRPLHM